MENTEDDRVTCRGQSYAITSKICRNRQRWGFTGCKRCKHRERKKRRRRRSARRTQSA